MIITSQPPIGQNDDYDSGNSWMSNALPSCRRKDMKRRGKRDEGPTQRHIVADNVSEGRTWDSTWMT